MQTKQTTTATAQREDFTSTAQAISKTLGKEAPSLNFLVAGLVGAQSNVFGHTEAINLAKRLQQIHQAVNTAPAGTPVLEFTHYQLQVAATISGSSLNIDHSNEDTPRTLWGTINCEKLQTLPLTSAGWSHSYTELDEKAAKNQNFSFIFHKHLLVDGSDNSAVQAAAQEYGNGGVIVVGKQATQNFLCALAMKDISKDPLTGLNTTQFQYSTALLAMSMLKEKNIVWIADPKDLAFINAQTAIHSQGLNEVVSLIESSLTGKTRDNIRVQNVARRLTALTFDLNDLAEVDRRITLRLSEMPVSQLTILARSNGGNLTSYVGKHISNFFENVLGVKSKETI